MAGYGTIAITTVGGVTNYIDNQGGQFNTINSDAQIAAAGANLLATVNPLLATTALNLSLGAMSTSIAAFAIDVKAGNNLNAVGDIFTAIGDAIGAAADVVAIVPGGGAIAAELDVAGDVATGAGVALIHSGDITTAIKEMATEISQGTFPAFEYLNGQIDNAKASISSALSATEKSLSEDFNFLSDAIKDVDTSAFTTIANTASNSLYSIDDTITSLFDATGDTTSKITDVTTGSSYSVTDVDSSTVLVSGASIISVDASSIGVTAVDADTKLSENANVGEDISETVDEANGTSQVTTYNADGSTVTDSYSGANGTGTLTSKDVEDLNGTSQITTYGADGSSVTSFYAGPNGTGTDFGQDVENSDGTSQWTVNFPDGSSVSSNYSGPKATGSVTSTTSVTGISADQSQTIVIHGSGFGTQAAYTGDSDDILFTDETRGWNAGYSLNDPSDFVTLSVESWTDSKIVLGGFAGDWGEDDWILNVGDTVEISVWNPQTGKLAGSVSASVTSGVSTSANDLDLKGTTNPDGSTITAVDGSGTSLSGTVTNDGNVIIDSIGDETDITAVGNTTLAGTGTVQMSNSAQNFIQGPIEPGARLTIATGQTIKGSGEITDVGLGSVVNKGTIIANQSTPLIIGSAIKNAGAMEANGGTLEVLGAVTGAGQFTIGDPSTLEFDSSVSSDQTIDMTGVGSTLILEDPLSFAADIVGFKDDDTIDFGTTAFTGVASITMFKAYKATLNKIVGGFAVEDQASALQADLLGLAADKSHINSIVAQNGLVTTNLATFKADKATLNKVVGGFAISATAANISANLNLLQSDVADISSIALTNPSSPTPVLKISKAQASADAGILAKVDSPYVLQIDHSKSKIITGYGDDLTIDVGGGDSTVTGGGSNETFLFGSNFKQATISDFATHASDGLHDTISLPAQDFTDWAALLGDAHASGTGGANTTFTAQDGASLTLLDVTLAQFQQTGAALQNDFTFHA